MPSPKTLSAYRILASAVLNRRSRKKSHWMMASDSSICLSPLLGSIMNGNWLLPDICVACFGKAACVSENAHTSFLQPMPIK